MVLVGQLYHKGITVKKAERVEEVKPHKPLLGQQSLLHDDDATETDGPNTQQVTIRVSRQALLVFGEVSERLGLKRNRLFDEAVQMYAAILQAGKRVN